MALKTSNKKTDMSVLFQTLIHNYGALRAARETLSNLVKLYAVNKSLSALPVTTRLQNGTDYGFDIDAKTDGPPAVFGFTRTKGCEAYRGKDWSVIVREIYQ